MSKYSILLFRRSKRPETCPVDNTTSAPLYTVLNCKTFDKKKVSNCTSLKVQLLPKDEKWGLLSFFFVLNWTLFWESLLLSNSEMMEFYITYISFSFVHIFHDFVIHIQFIYTVKIRNKIRKVVSWFYSRIWWSQFKS